MRKLSAIIFTIGLLFIGTRTMAQLPVVTSTRVTPTSLTLTWLYTEDAFHINVFRGSDADELVSSVLGTITGGTVTGLSPETSYYYRITNGFESSPPIAFTTPAAAPATICTPSQPAMTNAGSAFTTACFNWTDVCGDYNRFFIERSTNGGAFQPIASTGAATLNYCDNNLQEGAVYQYRVWARNDVFNINSDFSSPGYIQMLRHTPPTTPFGFTVYRNTDRPKSSVDMRWTLGGQDNLTNNPVAVQIWRSVSGPTTGFNVVNNAANLYNIYTDANLQPNTKYWYYVTVYNNYGVSSPSNVVAITTDGPPNTPDHFTIEATKDALMNSIIKLAWWDRSDNELAVNVERSIGNDQNFKEIAVLSPNIQDFTNIPLTEGEVYYYRIRASNICGNSGYSNVLSTKALVTKSPNAPYFLNAKGTAQGEATLSWSDDANNEEKFEVERSMEDKNYVKIGEVSKNITTYVDKGLTDNTLYYYRVRSINSLGGSKYVTAKVTTTAKAGIITAEDATVLYPNPTNNSARINIPNQGNEWATVRLVDNNNREVLTKTAKLGSSGDLNLDMSSLSEGIYTIHVQTSSTQLSKRIVKN